MNDEVRQNSPKAWLLAARPKTLTGAAVPVLIGGALAYANAHGDVQWLPLVLCMLFALVMQIDANFVNDYFDYLKGNDGVERLGPKRACTEGWVTPQAMRWALVLTTGVACLIGLPLVLYGGLTMIAVGVACVLFCFLYTTTLSYVALGDVLVLVFFGLVPVTLTYYLSMPEHDLKLFMEQNPDLQRDWDDLYGDRMQKLVFIGQHLDREAITRELDKCLDE